MPVAVAQWPVPGFVGAEVRPVHPAWTGAADRGRALAIAVVLIGPREPDALAAAVRGFRTVLPGAEVLVYDDGRGPGRIEAAAQAGAVVRSVPDHLPGGLHRRIFAEVAADIVILADGEDCDPCLAPSLVSGIRDEGKDFVNVVRLRGSGDPEPVAAERLLGWTIGFLYGRGGRDVLSGYKACSRRFARSYPVPSGADGPLALTLHALRLRMPAGEVAAIGRAASPTGAAAQPLALLVTAARLFVDERPRRVFGLAGLTLMAAGIAVALPSLRIHDWHATLPLGPGSMVSASLLCLGAACGLAGTALDMLAKARQEVKRLGFLAIPRRA